MSTLTDNLGRKRFIKGVLLAWIPLFVLTIPMVLELVRSFGQTKATGLGAVAGGLEEFFFFFGITAFSVSQVVAIVLLSRSVDKAHVGHSLFSVLSICCSALLLAIGGSSLWLIFHSSR